MSLPLTVRIDENFPAGSEITKVMDNGIQDNLYVEFIDDILPDTEYPHRTLFKTPLNAGEYDITSGVEYLVDGIYYSHPPYNEMTESFEVEGDTLTKINEIIEMLNSLPSFDDVTVINTLRRHIQIGYEIGPFEIAGLEYYRPHRRWHRRLTSLSLLYKGTSDNIQVYRQNRTRILSISVPADKIIKIEIDPYIPWRIKLLEGTGDLQVLQLRDIRKIESAIDDLERIRDQSEQTVNKIENKIRDIGRVIRDLHGSAGTV